MESFSYYTSCPAAALNAGRVTLSESKSEIPIAARSCDRESAV
jgi:hypothetical protein